MDKIIDDPRPIRAVWFGSRGQDDEEGAKLGFPQRHPVTKIEPYEENGQMAPVTWLRIWKGETVVARVNVSGVMEIEYGDDR